MLSLAKIFPDLKRIAKVAVSRSWVLAHCISFLLSGGNQYPIFIRKRRWLRALARQADRSQLRAYVATHCPIASIDVIRIGSEYGGYYVPNQGIADTWTVYSFGIGEDVSFDKALIERYRCQVHAFDPTPRSILFASKVSEELPGFQFYPFGVGTENGKIRFFAPRDPSHVSYSAQNIQGTQTYIDMDVRTLDSIQLTLGHEQIDLLKMNIEGTELSILKDIGERRIQIPVIISTLEAPVPFARYRRTLDRLLAIGYTAVKSDGSAITLVHSEAWMLRRSIPI